MARRPTSRPWTRLLALAILIIAAFATIFGAGYRPKLGLDLAGGTTVTLQPRSLVTHQEPKKAELDEAVDILRKRVNQNGVGGATVQEQYPYIVASVPSGTRSDVLARLSRTAQLYFRQVATGCTAIAGQDNCMVGDPSLLTPAQRKQEQQAEAKAVASASAAAAKSPKPSGTAAAPAASGTAAAPAASSTAGATAAPTAAGTATPLAAIPTGSTPSATVAGPAASTVSPAGAPSASVAASPSATTHGRPLSAALRAATPVAAASADGGATTGAATTSAAPVTSAVPVTSAAPSAVPVTGAAPSGSAAPVPSAVPVTTPTPAAAASTGPNGPLPAGNAPITWDQAKATAALTTLQCGNHDQQTRLGDFTAGSWALGCGQGTDTNKYLLMPAEVKGTSVKSADAAPATTSAGTQQIATGGWEVNISFKDSSFEKLTTRTAGGKLQVAIVLDGLVESAPVNQGAIVGDAQITGSFNQSSATDLANTLKFGSLPLAFDDDAHTETVSASLGKSSLHAGLLAGAIGLAIVILYCFVYYRALGLVTVASLLVSGSMVYAAVVLLGHSIGFTLSLAGIAGFIVAIGITADSFVVYYERIKDEVREGRAPRSAAESGWRAARRTIISADAVSLLAAVVLYVVTIGDVRGFALTLGLSTALDLVTVFLFTKPLVTILIQRPLFSTGKRSGLTAPTPQAPLRRRSPAAGSGVGRRPSSRTPDLAGAASRDSGAPTPAEAAP